MNHPVNSPLSHELELARTAGTLETVRLASRRRHPRCARPCSLRCRMPTCAPATQSRATEEMAWWMDVDAGGDR